MKYFLPRVMISGASSGSGKTTVVCGILKALKSDGYKISAFKCGPDYIDPMFHTKAVGVKCKNLDCYFCDDDTVRRLFCRSAAGSDISIIEGVMGYYDGISIVSDKASSYNVAKVINTPVVLVVNAKGVALTLAAFIKGIVEFRKDSNIQGVILNNISNSVYERLKPVIESEAGVRVYGYLPQSSECAVESRHLGLVTPQEIENINRKLEALGKLAAKCIDIKGIVELAQGAERLEVNENEKPIENKTVKIGVAMDNAFCFYYSDNIELLEELGCEIEYFSPIKDKELPKGIKGLLLGGGYPELYCKELSDNHEMRKSIKNCIENGMPCIAECGGFMYLHEYMEDLSGKSYPMLGVIRGEAVKKDRLVRFGYISVAANNDTPFLKKGESIKAHEFHYWDSTDNGTDFTAQKSDGRTWQCIHSYKNTFCGYPHIFFYSNTDFAKNFVEKCRSNWQIDIEGTE